MPSQPGTRGSATRRARVAPGQRKRVVAACRSCSARRIKCSGETPCRHCARGSRECEYPSTERVWVSRSELDALRSRVHVSSGHETPPQENGPRSRNVPTDQSTHSAPQNQTPFAPSPTEEMTPSEGRLLHDIDGTARYFGESSGANFLNHVKEFMTTLHPLVTEHESSVPGRAFLSSVGRYQTFDSRPLPLPSVDPIWLPGRTVMTVMLAEFHYLLGDGNGDFPSGGIYYCGDTAAAGRLAETVAGAGELPSGYLALLHVVFAVATQLGSGADFTDETQSEAFFARSRSIVGNPLDITMCSMSDMSVLLVMALYLVEMNRRDAAYMTVSMAIHLAVMYGAHRGYVSDEGTKRVFWSLYILDCWLSSWLGRPPTVADAAIRLDLPSGTSGSVPAMGLRAHVLLARISRYIACNVYRIAPSDQSPTTTVHHVHHALSLLHDWSDELPKDLRLDWDSPSLSQDRACCALHLVYNQEVLLTTRPIFFFVVKKTVADRYLRGQVTTERGDSAPHQDIVRQCTQTAQRNLRLGRWIRSISPRQKLLHQELHAIFNAALILMLRHLAFMDSGDDSAQDLAVATEVFEREAVLGNNFGLDCARVLQDLHYLVGRIRSQGQEGLGDSARRYDVPHVPGPLTGTGYDETLGLPAPSHLANDERGTLFKELQTWLDHDYMQIYNDTLT